MSDSNAFENNDWRKALELLLLRHAEQGANYDTSGMTESELWGLYLHLKRLEG
jgi:hypothetical protein